MIALDRSLFASTHGTHGTALSKIEIRNEGVCDRGVFTKVLIRRGVLLTRAEGEKISAKQMKDRREAKDPRVLYSVRMKNGSFVFGHLEPIPGRGLGMFVNDISGSTKAANAKFVQGTDDHVYVKLTRDVKAGEEVLVDYGDCYWSDWEEITGKSSPRK